MIKQLLKFEEIETEAKTKKFNVYSTHSGDFLGIKPSVKKEKNYDLAIFPAFFGLVVGTGFYRLLRKHSDDNGNDGNNHSGLEELVPKIEVEPKILRIDPYLGHQMGRVGFMRPEYHIKRNEK